jgi:hypothetical protein
MSTYGTMQSRIASELRRTGIESDIRNAIQESILLEEVEPYYFNQARAEATTVASQARYAVPTDFQVMRSLKALISDSWWVIEPRTYGELEYEHVRDATVGQPEIYAIWDQRFRLWPVPDQAYTLELSYVKSLSDLSDDADTNAWMIDGEPLIRYMAKAVVLRNIIQGPEADAMAEGQEAQASRARDRLRKEYQRRTSTGRLRPWRM